jgi:hypothetical protein
VSNDLLQQSVATSVLQRLGFNVGGWGFCTFYHQWYIIIIIIIIISIWCCCPAKHQGK